MRSRLVAAFQMALIFPAVLFMAAILIRQVNPLDYEPTHTAQQVVMWYAGRIWTLWLLLLALPFTVLVAGCAALWREWRPGNAAMLLVGAITLSAGEILAFVVLHMLAN